MCICAMIPSALRRKVSVIIIIIIIIIITIIIIIIIIMFFGTFKKTQCAYITMKNKLVNS